MDSKTLRLSSKHALSLSTIASKLAPTRPNGPSFRAKIVAPLLAADD